MSSTTMVADAVVMMSRSASPTSAPESESAAPASSEATSPSLTAFGSGATPPLGVRLATGAGVDERGSGTDGGVVRRGAGEQAADARRDHRGHDDHRGGRGARDPDPGPTLAVNRAVARDVGEQRGLDRVDALVAQLGQRLARCRRRRAAGRCSCALLGNGPQSRADAGETIADDAVLDAELFGGGLVGVALGRAEPEDVAVERRSGPRLPAGSGRPDRASMTCCSTFTVDGMLSSAASAVCSRSRRCAPDAVGRLEAAHRHEPREQRVAGEFEAAAACATPPGTSPASRPPRRRRCRRARGRASTPVAHRRGRACGTRARCRSRPAPRARRHPSSPDSTMPDPFPPAW